MITNYCNKYNVLFTDIGVELAKIMHHTVEIKFSRSTNYSFS